MTQPLVIHVVTSPDGGGAQRLVRELTERLPAHGVDTWAIYYRNPRNTHLSNREICLESRGVRHLSPMLALQNALRGCIADAENTVIHAHLTWPLYHLAMLRNRFMASLVFTEHSTHNKRRNIPWLRPIERKVYRQYDSIVAISGGVEELLGCWLEASDLISKITTITNGSVMLGFRERARPCARGARLVSVGSLTHQKGFDVAIRSVAKIKEKVDRYTIVGEGTERSSLQKLVKSLQLESKVFLPGYANDVERFLHDADLAVMPSRWEGFGLAATEALSTGLPIVASDVAGMRDVLLGCDAAVLSPPEDEQALTAGICAALDNLAGRSGIARKARLHAELFTIDSMVVRYAEIYKMLCHRLKSEKKPLR